MKTIKIITDVCVVNGARKYKNEVLEVDNSTAETLITLGFAQKGRKNAGKTVENKDGAVDDIRD